jgi:tetratricopeptide (TPR) repeat protein
MVTLWDVERGQRIASCKGHASIVDGLAFSPDGEVLATAGADRTVRLWDWRTGQERMTLTGHGGHVFRIQFSPDGKTLATAGDGTVRLWRAATAPEAIALRSTDGQSSYERIHVERAASDEIASQLPEPPAPPSSLSLVSRAGEQFDESAELVCRRTALDTLAAASTDQPEARWRLANGYFQLARKLYELDQAPDAEGACREALSRFEKLAKEDTENVEYRYDAGRTGVLLCDILENSERWEDALPVCRAAINRLQSVAWDRPHREDYREQVVALCMRLSSLLCRLGKPHEAAEVDRDIAATKLTPEELMARAQPAAERRDWKTAAAELGAGFKLVPPDDLSVWFALSLARVLAEDAAGYEVLARAIPRRLVGKESLLKWHLLEAVRTTTLRPRGAATPAELVRLARRAYVIERNHWNVHNLGVAHYRNGEFELARQYIEEALKMSDWYLYWPALAMTYHRLGEPDAARDWLGKSEEQFLRLSDTSTGRLKAMDDDPYWQDWAYFEAMLLEARALIRGEKK